MTWTAVIVLAAGSWALKAIGPVLAGGRTLPPRLDTIVALLPPALLAALVALQTLTVERAIVVDARLPAILVAGVALWRGAPFLVVVLLGTLTAAGLRALGVP